MTELGRSLEEAAESSASCSYRRSIEEQPAYMACFGWRRDYMRGERKMNGMNE